MVKKKTETAVVATRAEKKDATKNLIREELTKKQYKHNDLIEEVAKAYTQKFSGEETENINDVKGRVGSVLDIMKKDGDVLTDGGMYALKQEIPAPVAEKEVPKKKTVKKATKKQEEKPMEAVETTESAVEEKPVKKSAKKSAKAVKTKEETPVVSEVQETEQSPKTEEPAPKKRVKKTKKETVKEEKTEQVVNEPPMTETTEEKPVEAVPMAEVKEEALVVVEKAEVAPKNVVMDMSFLFGEVKSKQEQKAEKEEKAVLKAEQAEQPTVEEKPQEKQEEKKIERVNERKGKTVPVTKPVAQSKQENTQPAQNVKKPLKLQGNTLSVRRKENGKAMTEEEKLRESFLRRLRALGGDYFEYYSVYLLEKYSRRNGRRLEALRISGGERDGGVDGEIELTDKFGFRETIYIQSKNWDPDKGDEKLWVVGETLLQQFIGACICRQKKDGKQHTRGIFITTSRFTPEAKRLLDEMSDTIIGYDGAELFETAKECSFGLICKNGVWQLDEQLLSGTKAFFNML